MISLHEAWYKGLQLANFVQNWSGLLALANDPHHCGWVSWGDTIQNSDCQLLLFSMVAFSVMVARSIHQFCLVMDSPLHFCRRLGAGWFGKGSRLNNYQQTIGYIFYSWGGPIERRWIITSSLTIKLGHTGPAFGNALAFLGSWMVWHKWQCSHSKHQYFVCLITHSIYQQTVLNLWFGRLGGYSKLWEFFRNFKIDSSLEYSTLRWGLW